MSFNKEKFQWHVKDLIEAARDGFKVILFIMVLPALLVFYPLGKAYRKLLE